MKIGELSETTGLAPSRIRFYERIGLLKMVSRKANGYRTYPPEAVILLKLITRAQEAGFTLDELKNLLPTDMTEWNHDLLLAALQNKINDIESLQQKLSQNKAQLLELVEEIGAKPEDMGCAENAQRVLSQYGLSHKDPSEKEMTKVQTQHKHEHKQH